MIHRNYLHCGKFNPMLEFYLLHAAGICTHLYTAQDKVSYFEKTQAVLTEKPHSKIISKVNVKLIKNYFSLIILKLVRK